MFLLKASSLLVIVFVLLMFLFPGASGPYSVSHGPATAMRASRAAKRIFRTMTLCGCALLARSRALIEQSTLAVPSLVVFASVQPLVPVLSLRC